MSVPTQPSVLTVEQWNADPANAGYRMYITESGETAIQYVGQTAEWQKVGPMPEQLAIASQVGTPTDTYGGVVTEMQGGASVSPGGPRTPEATAALNAPEVGRETPAEQWDLKYGLDETGNEFAPKEQEGDPGLLRYIWIDNQMRRIAGDNGIDAGDFKPTNLIGGVLGGFGEALDQGRRRTVEALGDQAYNKITGQETDRGLLGTLAAPALWGFEQLNKLNLSEQTENQIGNGGGFSDWLADPANEEQVKQIYENGYNGFSGGDALWEYFVSDKTTAQRAILDIMNDPLTFLSAGASEAAKLAKPASAATTKALQAIGAKPAVAEAVGKGVGTGLQKLPYITDPTELAFPALGKAAQKTGLSKVGASIAANPTFQKLNPLAETEASKLRAEISRGEDAVANLLRNISNDPNVRMAGQEVNELPVTLVDHPEQAGQLLIFDPNTNEYMAVDNDGLMRVIENLKRVSGQDYRFTLDNRQSNSLNVNLGEILFGVAPIRTVDQMLETTNWRQKGAAFERYVDLLISRLDKAGPVERQQIIDNLYRYANDLARGGSENGRVFTPQQGAVEAARRMDTYDAMLAKSGYTDAKQVIHGQMANDLRQNALAYGYVRPQAPRESADLAARRAAAAAAAAPPPAAAAPAPRPQTLGEAGFTARHVPRPGFRNMFNGNTETYGMFVEGPDGEKYWMVATRRRGSGDPAVAWTPDDPAFDGDAVWHVYRADPDTGRITRERLTGAGRGAPPVTRADAERAILDDAIPPAAAPPPPPPTGATGAPPPTAATPPYTGALRQASDETVTVGNVEFDPFPAGQSRPVFLETPHGTITRVVLTNYQGQRVVVMMVWSDTFESWVPVDRIGSVGFELAPNMASDELTTMMRNLSDQIDDAFEEIDEELIDTLVPAWEADPEGAASILDSYIFGNAMAPGAQRPRVMNVINEEFSGRPGAAPAAAAAPATPEPTRTEPRARGTFEENGFTAESNPATDIETSRSPSGGYVVRQGYHITGPDGRRYLMTGERTTPTDEGIDILNDRRTEWRGFIVEDDGTLLPIDMMTLPNARNRRSGGWTLSTVREHILNHNLRGDSRYTPGEATARRVLGQGRARVDADGNPVRLTGTAESNGFTVRGGPDAEPRDMDVSQTTQDQFGAYVTHQRVRVLAPDGTRWVLVGRRVTPDLRNAAPVLDPDTVWIAHRYGDDNYSMYPVQADIPFDGANPRLQGYSYQTAMDILMNEAHHGDAMFGLGRVSPTIDPALIPDGVDPAAAQARQAARAAGAQQQGQPVSTYQGFEWQNERPALPGADGEPSWRDTALVADDELRDLDQSIGGETLGEFAVRTRARLREVRRAIDEQTAQNLDPMDDPRVAQFMDEYGPDGLGLIADPEDLRTMPDEIIDVVATAISRRQLEISKGVRNAAGQVVTKPVFGSMRLARALEKYDRITGFLKGSQLYNWANILPFATKQLVGNGNSITITHGVKGLKSYLSPKDWRRIYRRDVKGILSPEKSELDLMLEGYGLPVGNRIRQSTRTGSLGAVKLLQKEESQNALAKLLAPDELRVIGQIFDTSLRETVFKIYAKPKLVELKLAIRQHAFDQAQRFDVAVSREELDAFFDMLERQHPSKGYSPATLRQQLMSTYEYLAVGNAPGRVDEWAERVARDYLGGKMGDAATGFDGLRAIKLGAEDEMERIGFRFEERNIDAVLNRLVFYHYWSSRAGLLYGRELMRKPYLAVAYYRAMEGLKQEAERDNYPEWLRGWLQMMSSPAGFTTYLNPASTLNTMLTFAEAEFRDEGGSVSDLTTLGNWVDKSPVQVNPLLASIAYWAGALGSDAAMPNITGGFSSINKDALDLVNLFRTNVQGKPPLSQSFNITPMLQNRVANLITTWANNAGIDTNLVEKRNLNATQTTNRNWFVQQVLMESDPELTPDEVALVASQIQDDVDNPVVIEAIKRAGRVPFQGVYSTDPMTEGGFGAVLGGFLNTQLSPFAQVTRPSLKVANQALRKQGREEGGVPQEMLNTAYLQNAVATQASPDDLRFEQVVDGYYDIGSENQQQAERLYQQIRDGKPQEAVMANGKLWSVEEIMAMTPDRRQDLARVALYDAGLWGELQTLWKTKDAYEAQHSELKDYWEFKDVALNTPGGVEAWARDMMQRNVDFRRYVEQEIRFNPSMKIPGKDRTKMLLGTAAYRAAMSIPGSIYETEQTGRNLGPYGPSIAGVIPGLTASQQAELGIAGGGNGGSTSDSFEQYKTEVRKDIDNFAAMVEIMNQYDAQNGRREGTTVNQYIGRLLNGKEGGRLPSDVYDLIDETFGYVFPTKQTLKQYLIWMGDPTANPTGDGSVDLFLEWDSMERARRALGKPDSEGMADGALNRNTVYGNRRLVRAADGSGWSFVDASEADTGQPVPIRPVVTTSAPQLLLNPDNAYQTLAEVPPGLPLEVVAEQDGWVLVETPDGVQGWVQASQVMRAA